MCPNLILSTLCCTLVTLSKVGDWKAVVDMHDSPIKSGTLNGLFAFITWRSAYWTRTVSLANKMLIPMYWFKSWIFGRDVGMF
jgi:NADH dehydrogenase FAD-containing subunit